MKTKLTKEQSQHLIDLGVPKEKASIKKIEEIRIVKNTEVYDWCYQFTLNDLFEILPEYLKGDTWGLIDKIMMRHDKKSGWWWAGYNGNAHFASNEPIDALYKLTVWCIKNGYLKFD